MGKPRKQFHEGYWYHVYTRSLPEVSLFTNDDEREWFFDKLDEVFVRRRVRVGALCLMDTHYHALVKMGSVRLDRALNGLHMSYVKYVNRERDRRSSLFEKHPGTDIILNDSYLLQLVPYIHNNPIEAGIVESASDYEWHTDQLYRDGEWDHGPFECWEWPAHFRDGDRRRIYRERMGEDVEVPRNEEGYIGTKAEWKELEKRDEDRSDRHRDRRDRRNMEEIVRDHISDRDVTIESLKEPGRNQPEARIRQELMVEMYEEGYGPKEIGDYFGRHKGAVSYAVRTYG